MRGIMIAAGASVHSDLLTLNIRKPVEHAVVQLYECFQQSARGVELECQASFREIDLHTRCAGFQTLTNISRCILNQIFKKCFARISVQATPGIEEAQRRRRNHSLFHWTVSVSLSGLEVGRSMDAITEGASCQSRQLPGVTISKRNTDAIRGEILQAAQRIGCETRFGLFPIRDDGRSSCFQTADCVA